jgi:hypothetical protein
VLCLDRSRTDFKNDVQRQLTAEHLQM